MFLDAKEDPHWSIGLVQLHLRPRRAGTRFRHRQHPQPRRSIHPENGRARAIERGGREAEELEVGEALREQVDLRVVA